MKKSRPLLIFENCLGSKESIQRYTYQVKKFMKFSEINDFDGIILKSKNELQILVEDYVMHLKQKISPNSMGGYVDPIKTFLEANDIDLNWRKIKRLYPTKVKTSGTTAYTTKQIQIMLSTTNTLRNKAVIHFLASTGCRIGALPELKIRHLRDMPLGCKIVTVYEDSIEEYYSFLTPEASQCIDEYIDQRKNDHEVIDGDSPVFREKYVFGNTPAIAISKSAIQGVVTRTLRKSGIRGQKKNGRYAIQLDHGFRKRFDTILKLNKSVNDNIIEKMMGHKRGLDGVYLKPTVEQMFDEFKNGISDLTISDDERGKLKIQILESEKSELEQKNKKIMIVQEQISKIEKKLELITGQEPKQRFYGFDHDFMEEHLKNQQEKINNQNQMIDDLKKQMDDLKKISKGF